MSHTFYKAGIASGLVLGFLLPLSALAGGGPVGAVYTMSNAAEGNSILVFDRDLVGNLTPAGGWETRVASSSTRPTAGCLSSMPAATTYRSLPSRRMVWRWSTGNRRAGKTLSA